MTQKDDARRFAPAAARNREPIAEALSSVFEPLADGAVLLEIASGSGEHALHFAKRFPHLRIQASDPDASALTSIDAWREHADVVNMQPAARLDVTRPNWEKDVDATPIAALFCANMIHIAAWEACEGLWRGAGVLLAKGAPAVLYGPFKRGGRHTAPSNEAFDESLRSRNASWGVRDLEKVCEEAEKNGFVLDDEIAMPANNLCLIFRRS